MHVFNREIVQALCWTLVHSLWQGLLLAIAGGVVMIGTKKSASALRYILLASLFFAFIITACFTFNKELHFASLNTKTAITDLPLNRIQKSDESLQPVNGVVQIAVENNYIQDFEIYFDQHAPLVVTIWFIILSAHCIRLLANMTYTNRIRHFKTHAPSQYWQVKLFELAGRIQLKKRVSLLESEFIKVPMMIGFLKPVILFPFTLMSRLPPEQVEAVLLHELAHIKRKDYLVNLVQSFAEIFFFFNPGVLWISSLIRDERENCCDDIAISETKSKKEFLHALVSFQEYTMDEPRYALAFPGKKNHLLNRVKRIITNDNQTLNNMEKISLTAGIVIIGLITIASRQSTKQNIVVAEPFSKAIQTKQIIGDTVPDMAEKKESHSSKFTFKGTIDGKRYELHEMDDKVKELYVDGKKISDDKIDDYHDVISKMHKAAKEQQQKLAEQNVLLEKQRAELMEQEERMRNEQNELRERQSKEYEEAMDKFKIQQEELNAKMEEFKKEQEEIMRKQLNKPNQEDHELSNKQNKELNERALDLKKRVFELMQQSKMEQEMDMKAQSEILMKKQIDLKVQEMILQNEQLNINKMLFDHKFQHNLVSPPLAVLSPLDAVTNLTAVPPVPLVLENGTVSAIIDDLIDEKVITDRGDLSITLNRAVLKVNGVIQPEELHGRFKQKYIEGNSKNHVIYSKHAGSTSADIIINK